jgi:hypothetical protein
LTVFIVPAAYLIVYRRGLIGEKVR